jgi:putative colanic acid biosynthesis acetyltransferase WcaF
MGRTDMADILKNIDPRAKPSFSLKNRVIRSLWNTVYIVLFRHTPVICHPWRAFVLRCFGAGVGRGCHIYPKARIWAPWNMEIGDLAGIANDVECSSMDRIKIGEKAVISQGAKLHTGSHDFTDPGFQLCTKPVTIGKDAWVAAEAFILPGVTVGEGAVIGARSVVTRSMPAWTVCAGNPCKPIKPRHLKNG